MQLVKVAQRELSGSAEEEVDVSQCVLRALTRVEGVQLLRGKKADSVLTPCVSLGEVKLRRELGIVGQYG